MKRIYFLIKAVLICLLFICLPGCSNQNALNNGDWIIIDSNNISAVKKVGHDIVLDQSESRITGDEGLWYYNNLFFEDGEAYFTKTSTDKNFNVWIERIDKKTLKTTRKLHTSIDTNCSLLTDDFFYVLSNYMTYLEVDLYDLELNLVESITFKYDDTSSLYPTDLLEIDGYIYMVCGIIPENADFGYTENYIFKLDKNFTIIDQFDLNTNDGSFFSFVQVKDKLFLTKTTDGLVEEERLAKGGNEILIFDLKEEKMSEERIKLTNNFPFHIVYDEDNNNLIISNGENGPTSNHIWTVYNLDTYEESIIPIDYSIFEDNYPQRSAYFCFKDSKYYLLFSSKLIEYDVETKELTSYDLSNIGIEDAVLMIFPKESEE